MSKRPTSSVATDDALIKLPLSDELLILSFNVGHGDCTLLEYHGDGAIAFRCLVDAGTSLPPELTEHLQQNPRTTGLPDIDVLVLSHVDADHQGGFPSLLAQGVTVGEYLGPCLPTFRRLQWLFSPRVRNAVEKASTLETELLSRNIPVGYPLEGYKAAYAGSRVTLSVISPAARLLKSLSTLRSAELSALLRRNPLPLQWLLDPDEDDGLQDDYDWVHDLFRDGALLSPNDFSETSLTNTGVTFDELSSQSGALDEGLEPDFFGNSVLNDTSLILIVDVHLNATYRRRIVLTGDQENWTYITARHPGGLGVDVLKAPHHGGKIYMHDRAEAMDSLYLWLRPRTVIVSANGRHKLPRDSFRDSVRKIGATLLCPNKRGIEPLSAGMVASTGHQSCFGTMNCTSPSSGVMTLRLTGNGDSSDTYACVQGTGHSGVAPIVVMRQEIVPVSDSLVRYTRRELERHGNWIKQILLQRHSEFKSRTEGNDDEFAVRAQAVAAEWSSIVVQAKAAGRHDLVADPAPVLSFARSHRLFWTNADLHRRRGEQALYKLPSSSEIEDAQRWTASIPRILLRGTYDARTLASRDPVDILTKAEWTVLDSLIGARLGIPVELVADEIRPLMISLIAEGFSCRSCCVDWPRTKLEAGELYLLLENKSDRASNGLAAFQPSGEVWDTIWDWYKTEPAAPWKELHDFAETQMLCGNFPLKSYDRGSWIKKFYGDSQQSFADRFLGANWTVLW